MSFTKKHVNNNYIPQLETHDHRSISVTAGIKDIPNELKPYLEMLELKQYVQKLLEYIKGLNERLEHTEQFLTTHDFEQKIQSLDHRVQLLEQKMEKVLTHPNDLALQLTSDKAEIRRLAEEVVKVKQAIGVASGA